MCFKAVLKNGQLLDFDHLCNAVDYKNLNFCVFKHETESTTRTLALIPYDNILYIEDDVVSDKED